MDISIIIVSWNTGQLLDSCLSSIYRETKNMSFEIIVVDNASSDKSAEMVLKKYPQVELIKNEKNKGFAAANNQALQKAAGKYILILNPDTVILDNAIGVAMEIMKKDPKAGILGAKTFNRDMSLQKTVRHDPSLLTQLLLPSKMKKLLPNWQALKNYYYDDFNYGEQSFVEQMQGSFLLIGREVFDKIGFFDEKFFLWLEEVDLCLRARKAGYKLIYSPDVKIIHYGGESFAQLNTLKKQGLYARSLLHYFWKNKPKRQWLALYLIKLPILILT